jgi:hypothetical protein
MKISRIGSPLNFSIPCPAVFRVWRKCHLTSGDFCAILYNKISMSVLGSPLALQLYDHLSVSPSWLQWREILVKSIYWWVTGINRSILQGKPPVPLCPPETPYGWNRVLSGMKIFSEKRQRIWIEFNWTGSDFGRTDDFWAGFFIWCG